MTLVKPLVMQASGGDPAISYSAAEIRAMLTVLLRNEGILQAFSPGFGALRVSQRGAGANFSVDVAAGAAVIQGDDVSDQMMYVVRSTAVENLVIPAAPVSGSRTHRVIARIKDELHNGTWSTYEWTLEVLPDVGSGTPALPNSAISLATVTVAAGQASVQNAHITDLRVTALLGPARRTSVSADANRPAVPATGEEIYRTDKGYVEFYDGTSWVPWVIKRMAPIQVSDSSTVTTSSTTYVAGSPVVSTTFVAPPSGKIWVTLTAQVEAVSPSSGIVTYQIHNGATSAGSIFLTANQDNAVAMQEDHFVQASNRSLVTGLTPGATYYIQTMHRTSGVGDVTCFLRRIGIEEA